MARFPVRYVIHRRKTSKRSGAHDYLYWHPPRRYLDRAEMRPRRLAADLPSSTPFETITARALVEAAALNAELDQRLTAADTPAPSTVAMTMPWLIAEWRSTPEYLRKSESTRRRSYDYACRIVEAWSERNRHPSIRKIDRPAVWRFRETLYTPDPDTGEPNLHRARMVLSVLRLLLEFAYNRGLLPANPAKDPKIIVPPARDQVWSDAQLDAAITKARELGRPSIALALRLGADTAQCVGDVLSLPWKRLRDDEIVVRQAKGKKWVNVPLLDELAAALAELPRGAGDQPIVVVEGSEQPYSYSYFSHELRRIMDAAELPRDLEFRDLRRTAVVHMGRAGLAPSLITAVTGHTIDECLKILEVYMPRDSEMARRAIALMRTYRAEQLAERAAEQDA
jgi:hypothetical protein